MINVTEPIIAEHRRTIFSDKGEIRPFMPGATIAEIVNSFDKPREFEDFGVVVLVERRNLGIARLNAPQGEIIDRALWHCVRPKPGAGVFISSMPEKEGNIGSLIAEFAILTATIYFTAGFGAIGAASLFSPAIAGVAGVAKAAGLAALLVGAQVGVSLLSKPVTGAPVTAPGGAGQGQSLGQAGIGQNPLGLYKQMPCVLGKMRVSPPLLTMPYTVSDGTDQWVYMVCGICGPCQIANIKVNETAIEDYPTDSYQIETREGMPDDDPLTIVTQSVFEQSLNEAMSTHRVNADNFTLTAPATASYPQPRVLRSARRTNRFRIILGFPSGVYTDASGQVQMSFRLRMRRVGDSIWTKFPEALFQVKRRAAFRQEIWFVFGGDEIATELAATVNTTESRWILLYAKNSEWTADTYFNPSPNAVDTNTIHTYAGKDQLSFHLHTDTFDIDQYDFEITRSCELSTTTLQRNATSYVGGAFTYTATSAGGTVFTIPDQSVRQAETQIESYASFREEYPILDTEIAIICGKFKNIHVNSLSAEFTSYVDGVPTSDPGALLKFVLTGPLNPIPEDPAKIEDLSDWTTHCAGNDLSCNLLVSDGSVEKVATTVAATGDAVLKREEKTGVIIDRDRSGEGVAALFTQAIMTKPLQITRTFLTGPRAIAPSFNDSTQDYKIAESDPPVFDDGVSPDGDERVELVTYDGLVTEAAARRRALIDLRRLRLRANLYSWEVNCAHLPRSRGDVVGVANDILLRCYGASRVLSFSSAGGNLTTITLESNVADIPVIDSSNLFNNENIFIIADLFTLSGITVGAEIELTSGAVVTIPINGVSGATLTVSGTVAVPDDLGKGNQVSIGPVGLETRRVIVSAIKPSDDLFATIEAYDEASEIFAGL